MTEGDCYAAIEVPSGKSTLFIPRLPAEYAIWMGAIIPPEGFTAKYGVDVTLYVDEVASWLGALPVVASASAEAPAVHTLHGLNSDSGNTGPPLPNFDGFDKFPSTSAFLRTSATETRVIKSAAEVALLQKVNDIASDAHMAAMRHAKPGEAPVFINTSQGWRGTKAVLAAIFAWDSLRSHNTLRPCISTRVV